MTTYVDTLSPEKSRLQVVIFGPYGNNGTTRLYALKNHLVLQGYTKTEIVRDLPDPPGLTKEGLTDEMYWYKRSMFWLEQSSVNLFAFLKGSPLDSVIVEMVESVIHFHKMTCTTFMIEKNAKLESLVKGFLNSHGCNVIHFTKEKELHAKATSACWNHISEDYCSHF